MLFNFCYITSKPTAHGLELERVYERLVLHPLTPYRDSTHLRGIELRPFRYWLEFRLPQVSRDGYS
jgi:hypothetical protein